MVWTSEPGYIRSDMNDVLHLQVVSHYFHFGEGRAAQVFRSPHRYIWPANGRPRNRLSHNRTQPYAVRRALRHTFVTVSGLGVG